MIKSLLKRTEDILIHALSELEQIKDVDRRANYEKLLQVHQNAQRQLRELALETDNQKEQCQI